MPEFDRLSGSQAELGIRGPSPPSGREEQRTWAFCQQEVPERVEHSDPSNSPTEKPPLPWDDNERGNNEDLMKASPDGARD